MRISINVADALLPGPTMFSHSRRPTMAAADTILRPELTPVVPKWWQQSWDYCHRSLLLPLQLWHQRSVYRRQLAAIAEASEELADYSDQQLRQQAQTLRQQFAAEGVTTALVNNSFALGREVSGRVLGMYHFNTQLMAGLCMLDGNIAEMATGEGKTLTALLPALTTALAGIPVHVISVNDYLTLRDYETLKPVYDFLALSIGVIQHDMALDERQRMYGCSVVYCANNQLVFDYLKDQLLLQHEGHQSTKGSLELYADMLQGDAKPPPLMLRGLHYAIVDEADSVLMDEARTPLIISADTAVSETEQALYAEALALASALEEGLDYRIEKDRQKVDILAVGETKLTKLCLPLSPYWQSSIRRLELVEQALTAQIFYLLNQQYLIRDNKIEIIDQQSGRILEGRTWQRGLHQLIEAKEGLTLSPPRKTLSQISYQRFFRQFRALGGMTGTAQEVKKEMQLVYHLPTQTIPFYHRSLRQMNPWQWYRNQSLQYQAVIDEAEQYCKQGRSVLIASNSVETSQQLSDLLTQQNIEHSLLNASQDEQEAEIISRAGESGMLTIATSMAGRGTDIKLAETVKEQGGLHLIMTQIQSSNRVDRQLIGRVARFGDPGSVDTMLSIDDYFESWPEMIKSSIIRQRGVASVAQYYVKWQQNRQEIKDYKQRKKLLYNDEKQRRLIAFGSGNK